MTATAVAIAIFGGAFITLFLIALALGNARRARDMRINAVRKRAVGATTIASPEMALILNSDKSSGLEKAFAGLFPKRAALQQRLRRSGTSISVGRYVMISLGLIGIFMAMFKLLFDFPAVVAVLGGVAVGLILPHVALNFLIARRVLRFTQLFPEAIDLMVRGLKSGLPITEIIVNVGQEMAEPVGVEFRTIGDAVRLGKTLEEALWEAVDRLDTQEFKFFVISLAIQRETGGNLAETLANLSDILRKRLQMKLKVKAMSSEARASAYILGSLPFIMFGILYLMSPDYALTLLNDPRGNVLVGIAFVMQSMGAFTMFKMVRFEI